MADRGKPFGAATGLVIGFLLALASAGMPPPARAGGGAAEAPAGPAEPDPAARLRGWAEIRGSVPLRLHRRPAAWLLLLPGPLLLAGQALLRRGGGHRPPGPFLPLLALLLLATAGSGGRPGAQGEAEPDGPSPAGPPAAGWAAEAERAFEQGDLPAALRLYGQVEQVLPDSAALQRNLAVVYRAAGRPAEAVHRLRRALRLNPLDRPARRELQDLEREAELAAQAPPGVPVPPEWPFIAFLVLANLTAVAALLSRRRGSPGLLALALLLAFLSLAAMGAFVGLCAVENRPAGVAAAGAALSQVPEPGAVERTPLPAGTSLRIRGAIRGYWLVETGLGVRGWIAREKVLVDAPRGL